MLPIKHVECSVVIVIADGETARREHFLKGRAALLAYIEQLAVGALMEQQQRLFVTYLLGIAVDHVVGVAVGQDQIDAPSLS